MKAPKQPTAADCSSRKTWIEDGYTYMACWYPQMGGYGGKCVVQMYTGAGAMNECFDAYIWHDGEFPFGDAQPTVLHHCDAQQFVTFGNLVAGLAQTGRRMQDKS